jgi:hypothetical protein
MDYLQSGLLLRWSGGGHLVDLTVSVRQRRALGRCCSHRAPWRWSTCRHLDAVEGLLGLERDGGACLLLNLPRLCLLRLLHSLILQGVLPWDASVARRALLFVVIFSITIRSRVPSIPI